jgi:splicing factor 3B subunit 4
MNNTGHRNQDATIYVGNLHDQVDEELLWELFTQVGRVVKVYMPKDRVLNKHKNMGFVEFRTEADAEYAQLIMNMVKLYGRPIRVSQASMANATTSTTNPNKRIDIGANIFIGNLSSEVDDKILHDTFSAFGRLLDNAHVAVDDVTGRSLSYGFAAYDSFEASDAAIQAMDGQFLCGRTINVSYAFKKDASKKGERERHGSAAERLLASQSINQKQVFRPNTHFSTGPNSMPIMGGNIGVQGRMMGMGIPPPPPPPGMMMQQPLPGMMMQPPPHMMMPGMMQAAPPPPPPMMMMGVGGLLPPPPLPPPPPSMMIPGGVQQQPFGMPPGTVPPPLPPPPPPL